MEIGHEMRVDLEPKGAQQGEGTLDLLDGAGAMVGTHDRRVERLHTDLHLGAA